MKWLGLAVKALTYSEKRNIISPPSFHCDKQLQLDLAPSTRETNEMWREKSAWMIITVSE